MSALGLPFVQTLHTKPALTTSDAAQPRFSTAVKTAVQLCALALWGIGTDHICKNELVDINIFIASLLPF